MLSSEINLTEVIAVLSRVQHGDNTEFSRECYNAFYSCMAFLRHAFRWGINPIVVEAQLETLVVFPDELDVPWQYLKQHFGFASDSGTFVSNTLLNFHEGGDEAVYVVNSRTTRDIEKSEQNFYLMFRNLERLSIPIYRAMISALYHYDNAEIELCRNELESLRAHLRLLFSNFSTSMHESKMVRSVWLQHVQGFHAWGAGRMESGGFHAYDGFSGGHVLVIQALDAFIGLEPLFSEQQLHNYVSSRQRHFISVLRKCSFRARLKSVKETEALAPHLSAITKQLKV
ncbi:hypothetical protein NLG97_g1737 [Lecanicillium saksenae]|uniref:Uncharacterized protein n=1 Tax=Lecanicillium saksenae TaxID=468837 RepID=A0ACC1R4L5_9HYPO|nr:hypothetical protein NLG97_g1737 [Lecanicillium saksenae]